MKSVPAVQGPATESVEDRLIVLVTRGGSFWHLDASSRTRPLRLRAELNLTSLNLTSLNLTSLNLTSLNLTSEWPTGSSKW
jgi:hypothetical protein